VVITYLLSIMIREIHDISSFEKFVKELNHNTFLQTSGWIEFNKQQGLKTFLLGQFNSKKLHSALFAYIINAKRGRFLFVPHGPVCKELTEELLRIWVVELKKIAKREKCLFIRISPIVEKGEFNTRLFDACGFRPSPSHMHAELTTLLDLRPDLDSILMNMRKTTRQMCRKSTTLIEQGNVTIEQPVSITDEMYEVYESTTKRGGFVGFSKKYIQREYDCFNNDYDKAEYRVVKFEGKILSWGLFIFSGERAFYHQGANILHKQIPASYMSHWLGIQRAKELGCISYDFWGVGPKDIPTHPWATISQFKRGFGGDDKELVHAQDYPLSPLYWFTWIVETVRAKRRGFS
jgi:lipid II:glycine glycyltransferase (peptidoglycan interpeptide bridge formation enzyme)